MNKTTMMIAAGLASLGLTGAASAASHPGQSAGKLHAGSVSASRLDDGKSLLAKAAITEQQAIAAAQSAASGALNEVDLEYAGDKLVFTVDVGSHDVKVDAADGKVVAVEQDD